MKKKFIEYKGEKFPVRTINLGDYFEDEPFGDIDVADADFFWAYEDEYEKDVKDVVEIDSSIAHFCDVGFIASDPTDKEIADYLKKAGF